MFEERESTVAELLEEVRRIEAQSKRLATDVMAGGYNSVFRGAGVEFDEVREYAEGDDPRSVDWNVTARAGRPFIKKYVDERELTVMFALDVSPSMRGGAGAWSARGAAARVLACLALTAVRNDDRVGLVTFADGVRSTLPPRKGRKQVLRVIRDALANAADGGERGSDAGPALELLANAFLRRSVVFVLSDFLQPVERWRRPLARCARRHDVVAVRIGLPEAEGALAGGLWNLRDPESGRERPVDLDHEPSRARFAEHRRGWDDALREGMRHAGVDLIDVAIPRRPDPEAFVRPLLAFFRARELRGTKR